MKVEFADLGEQTLKNIARPMRAYQVISGRSTPKTEPTPPEPASTRPVLPDKPSLAVLPFENMSGDAEQEYFADGVVEDIITALSRFKSFAVIARNSSFVYKGRAVDVRQVAKELGVRYVLEGSVRRSGERLRITAQLVDGTSGTHLWADRFEGAVAEVFDAQDRITESVATIVEPQIREAEIERSRRERPGSVAAYDLYLQGLQEFRTTSLEGNAAAYALFSAAVALEPNNGVFLAKALHALEHRSVMGWPMLTGDDKAECRELIRQALANAPDDASVLATCGIALIGPAREYDLGLAMLRRAVEANPNHFQAVINAGIGNIHCGSLDDALTYFHRALRLSPADPDAFVALAGIAHVHVILGNYAEALPPAERSLTINASFNPTYWILIAANAHLGRMDEARRFLAALKAVAPNVTIASLKAGQPAKYPSRLAPILDGLRLAGLEES
jgi:TolB-like protein